MGMDLIPRKRDLEAFSFNWGGWVALGQALQDVMANTSEMAGSNDGEWIRAATLKDWGRRLAKQYGPHPADCKMDTCGGTDYGATGWPGGWEGKLRCFANWCQKAQGCRQC